MSFTDVVALCKHSDAQSSDFDQTLVFTIMVQPRIFSRRISGYSCCGTASHAVCRGLKARDMALSTRPLFCGIPRPLQKSTNIPLEYYVLLSVRNARRTLMFIPKRLATAKTGAVFFSRAPYGRSRREVLSTNITTYDDSPRDVG